MKRMFSLALALILALSVVSVSASAYTEYTSFNIVFKEKEGAKVNDTDIRIFASVSDGELTDRTDEFVTEGLEWFKYLAEPEAGKTAEDYDYVDEALEIYGILCDDNDVFDHKNYSYFMRIASLHPVETDISLHRNVKFNGVDVDELNGTCYNSGNDFFIKTVTNGSSGYDASGWAQDWIAQADELGLIPDCLVGQDLTRQITRREFAAVAVKIYESLAGSTVTPGTAFADCDDPEVLKAVAIGITNGTDTAKNLFSPDANITREQCAAMLTRAYKAVALDGWTLAADGSFNAEFRAMFTMPATFADDADISAYAKDSVYFMKAQGIIDGVGNNLFAPKHGATANEAASYGLATREQALKIAVGMVENLK